MNTISVIYALDRSTNYHSARLLLLLRAMLETEPQGVDGLTKLAKLDFLVRYPTLLQRALTAVGRAAKLQVDPEEQQCVESAMVRYKYGPWDHKYKVLLVTMRARRLIRLEPGARSLYISLTDTGYAAAEALSQHGAYSAVVDRSKLVVKVFGAYRGSRLKNFVYDTFPELRTMRPNKEITTHVH